MYIKTLDVALQRHPISIDKLSKSFGWAFSSNVQCSHYASFSSQVFNIFQLGGNFVSYMLDSVPLGRFCQRAWAPNFKDTWSAGDVGRYFTYTLPAPLFELDWNLSDYSDWFWLHAICVRISLLDFGTGRVGMCVVGCGRYEVLFRHASRCRHQVDKAQFPGLSCCR